MSANGFRYEPTSLRFQAHLHEHYRTMRDEHAVYREPRGRYLALSRYDDVLHAARNWRTYAAASEEPDFLKPLMSAMDPPEQTRLRGLVARAFTTSLAAQLEGRIHRLADELLDRADEDDLELMEALARPLPAMVIAEMLGLPDDRLSASRHWTEEVMRISVPKEQGPAAQQIYALFEDLLDERRTHPGDDLLSGLATAEVEGERLTDDEVLGFAYLLLIGGTDTTTNLIGNAAHLLAIHPDQRAALLDDPTLIPSAVEEVLRFEAPTQALSRFTRDEVHLHDQTIPAGSVVLLLWGSANLDERAFEDPERFDIRRDASRHLAFGHGVHFCMGAALARLEARIAIEHLLARHPTYALVDADPPRVSSSWARGFEALRLTDG